jgi:hypothetical protein
MHCTILAATSSGNHLAIRLYLRQFMFTRRVCMRAVLLLAALPPRITILE